MEISTKERDFMGRWRDQTLGIRLTEDEKEKILTRMRLAGKKNVTDFILDCVFRYNILSIDTKPILAVKNEMSRIGSNINQIARVANTSKNIYRNDVIRLEQEVDELRELLHKHFKIVKDAKENGVH